MNNIINPHSIHSFVRRYYGKIAETIQGREEMGATRITSQEDCCTSIAAPACGCQLPDISGFLPEEILPADIIGLSLGCGYPIELAELEPGQIVVDLGSGAGMDCFQAAKMVAPMGKVIGVDMTPQMLELARANQLKFGIKNVEFRLGEIEHLPVADASVDVVISNCVINLSPDKTQVLQEAFRILKPGGKLAISDIVTDAPLSPKLQSDLNAWANCVAGAIEVREYLRILEEAGFEGIQVLPVQAERKWIENTMSEMNAIGMKFSTPFSAYITAFRPLR